MILTTAVLPKEILNPPNRGILAGSSFANACQTGAVSYLKFPHQAEVVANGFSILTRSSAN